MGQIVRRRDLDVPGWLETVEHGKDLGELVLVYLFQFHRIRYDRCGQIDFTQIEPRPGFAIELQNEICLLSVIGRIRQVFPDAATYVQSDGLAVLVGKEEFQYLVCVLTLPGIDAHADHFVRSVNGL